MKKRVLTTIGLHQTRTDYIACIKCAMSLLGETNLISSLAGRWMKKIGSVGRNNNNNNPEI